MQYILSGNLALGKGTFQSSTAWAGEASYAVDGNPNPEFNAGSCTHTSTHDDNPWWGVDLGADYLITQVVIINRGDCCGK